MVDQIVDKRTVAIPGPIGRTGPKGPMNPDTVPVDQSVADWIGTPSTATAKALEKWRIPSSVTDYGVPNYSDADVSALINAAIVDNGLYAIHFPVGIYHINQPIRTYYNTDHPVTISFDPGAVLCATAPMDDMITVGYIDKGEKDESADYPVNDCYSVSGGIFNANGMAQNAIHITSKVAAPLVHGCLLLNAIQRHLWIEKPEKSQSIDSQISDIRINMGPSSVMPSLSAIGIQLDADDNMLTNVYVNACHIGIKGGYMQVHNVHIFSGIDKYGDSHRPAIGIWSYNGIRGDSLYLDCLNTGIMGANAVGGYTQQVFSISNLFFLWLAGSALDYPTWVMKCTTNSTLDIADPHVSISDDQQHGGFVEIHGDSDAVVYEPLDNLHMPMNANNIMIPSRETDPVFGCSNLAMPIRYLAGDGWMTINSAMLIGYLKPRTTGKYACSLEFSSTEGELRGRIFLTILGDQSSEGGLSTLSHVGYSFMGDATFISTLKVAIGKPDTSRDGFLPLYLWQTASNSYYISRLAVKPTFTTIHVGIRVSPSLGQITTVDANAMLIVGKAE